MRAKMMMRPRRAPALLVLGVLGVLSPLLVDNGARAVATPPRTVHHNSLNCPTSTHPTDGSGAYAVAFQGSLGNVVIHGGWDEKDLLWGVNVTNVTGKVCGLLNLPGLDAVVQPDGVEFDSANAVITVFLGGVIFNINGIAIAISATAPLTAKITGVEPDGTLDAAARAPTDALITGTSIVNGSENLRCHLTLTAGVTTGTSTVRPTGRGDGPWTMSGTSVHGPLIGATGGVVGNDFVVPALPQEPFGQDDCNLGGLFNEILSGYDVNLQPYQLPTPPFHDIAAGETQVSADLTVTALDLPVGVPSEFPS